jgi:hypothetical protein
MLTETPNVTGILSRGRRVRESPLICTRFTQALSVSKMDRQQTILQSIRVIEDKMRFEWKVDHCRIETFRVHGGAQRRSAGTQTNIKTPTPSIDLNISLKSLRSGFMTSSVMHGDGVVDIVKLSPRARPQPLFSSNFLFQLRRIQPTHTARGTTRSCAKSGQRHYQQ